VIFYQTGLGVLAYVLTLALSGWVVKRVLNMISHRDVVAQVSAAERDAGFIIGKCENILTLTFVLSGELTAVSLFFAAKGLIRKEDIRQNSLYFLAGTLVNITFSTLMGLLFRLLIAHPPGWAG
jgi:hypothetical protein